MLEHLTLCDLTNSAAPLRYPRPGKEAHRIDIARMGSGIEMVFTHGMEFGLAGQKRRFRMNLGTLKLEGGTLSSV